MMTEIAIEGMTTPNLVVVGKMTTSWSVLLRHSVRLHQIPLPRRTRKESKGNHWEWRYYFGGPNYFRSMIWGNQIWGSQICYLGKSIWNQKPQSLFFRHLKQNISGQAIFLLSGWPMFPMQSSCTFFKYTRSSLNKRAIDSVITIFVTSKVETS